ncbi:YaiI/YqxD family protein [Natribacillus halophilus]|uniref:UPF0178 protein SAMN04488123_10421 n=1 Tax=Natribacillus halophilus TaxID=549003 RepID=A0A1G8M7T6_9BACI|nr:YaiI/YqxD family protein [Natribacillus halophilus]SDI64026.1 hypothetical protein SAMN04488123_10421 [Natribacillus halophilus]
MKIYVDADACPVNDIVIDEALSADIPVILVKSYDHFSIEDDPAGVESIYVDTGSDSADYRIMALAEPNDVIITQDYGLAALGLANNCTVLHHNGFVYTNDNIESLLHNRHTHAKMRRSGQKTKGPKPFTNDDRARFRKRLQRKVH